MSADHLTVNINVLGVGQRPAAWRSDDITPDAVVDLGHWQAVAREAERGLVDAVFLADRPAITDPRSRPVQYLDPSILVPAMAAVTDHLGFIATASTTLNEPAELARRLGSIHRASGRRFGWNAVTTWDVEAVRNHGIDELPPREQRYARAESFVAEVLAHWGDDRPAVVQAGGSGPGVELAGRFADAVYSVAQDPDASAQHRLAVREVAVASGRPADAVRVLPGLAIVIGSTEQEARDRFDHWEHLAPATYSLAELGKALGADLLDADLDAPVPPDVVDAARQGGAGWSDAYRRTLLDRIARGNPTVRELLRDFGGYGQRFIAGTPEQIVDSMEAWFRAGAADGFNVMLDLFPSGLTDFVDHVVPELQRRGLYRTAYDDGTLRDRLARP